MQVVVVKHYIGNCRSHKRYVRAGYHQLNVTTTTRTNGSELACEEGKNCLFSFTDNHRSHIMCFDRPDLPLDGDANDNQARESVGNSSYI